MLIQKDEEINKLKKKKGGDSGSNNKEKLLMKMASADDVKA